ncbi:Protein of unknown function DUF1064 [uncultured Caudovirales phage]|uniref:DUF1064 domain-containing protein n=1 Tax=uncultured Caudovirales phage TaxID=2100421 RepID=A0A6J5LBE1_9CAUD|nr:Protein of unknown function DUF1064 [uncultured Caudovirales phage]
MWRRRAGSEAKFSNIKTIVDGIRFDSRAEARQYGVLKMREKIGEILDLELQPSYDLIVNGQKVCSYRADFRYRTTAGDVIVEDVKSAGTMTPVFRLKKKLMLACLGVEIHLIGVRAKPLK